MDSNHVTVVYKWTAQPGKLDELASIYADVTDAMQANEPGAEAVHIYVSEQDNAVYVRDEFQDAAAMGCRRQRILGIRRQGYRQSESVDFDSQPALRLFGMAVLGHGGQVHSEDSFF